MNLRTRAREQWRKLLRALGVNVYLCHGCKYNNARDCRHRKRPRATFCEDYRPR
ncbi:MAG: hypothetical protein ACK47B_06150 [Armatimonadota bacterium]